MIAALTLALMIQQSAPDMFPKGGGERYAKQIRADLRHCHVTPGRFSLTDDFIYDEVVIPLQEADLSDDQVGCLANTRSLDGVSMTFANPEDEALYRQRFAQRPDVVAAQAEMIHQQRQWLADQGLLADLPQYDRAQPLSVYTAAVERHCRAEPGSVLMADDEKRTVSGAPNGLTFNDTTQCVFTILILAMAEGDGADITLTGEDHAP